MELMILKALTPLPPPERGAESQAAGLTPLELRDILTRGLAAKALPYLDSRTGYWRYYLVRGPGTNWRSDVSLGRKLLAIGRQNRGVEGPIDSSRIAARGYGRNLRNRKPGRAALIRLSKRFDSDYAVAAEFWERARSRGHDFRSLRIASGKVRAASGRGLKKFFAPDMWCDGNAKAAFHRVISSHPPEARQLATHLRRNGWAPATLIAGMTTRKWKALLPDNARILIAWAILWGLFRDQKQPIEPDPLRTQVARAAVRGLQAGVENQLPAALRGRIIELLRATIRGATRGRPYVPPLLPPPPEDDQSRTILYADLRLTSFARLLQRTA